MFDVDLPGMTIRVMGPGAEVSLIPWTCVWSPVVPVEYVKNILNKHRCLRQCVIVSGHCINRDIAPVTGGG